MPSVNDVSDKLFLITVWDDENGEPGEVLYEDDVFNPRNPIYVQGENQYLSYYFIDTMKVSVGSSFFVGWRQLDADRLNLGFDRNIDQSNEIFYSVNGGVSWLVSPFSGSAMVRPIFSTEMDASLGLIEPETKPVEITLFPNPTREFIYVQNSFGLSSIEKFLYDASGRALMRTTQDSIDLRGFDSGIYFISVPSVSEKRFKVIRL